MSKVSIDELSSRVKNKSAAENKEEIRQPGKDAPVIQPLQDSAKSSVDTIELPTGYIDIDGVLHKEVSLREITGEEEDILTSRKTPTHLRMNKILENCVTSIGPYDQFSIKWKTIIKDLVASDRLFLIIQLRILSLGPIYSAKMQCENCEAYSNENVDLNDFKIEGLKDPMERQWTGSLPGGKEYVAKTQTGWEEAKLAKHSESKDIMSLSMLARIVSIDGNDNVNLHMLKKMSLLERQHLRKDFTSREGSIDKSLEYECQECGQENSETVDIGTPNFFFPSET